MNWLFGSQSLSYLCRLPIYKLPTFTNYTTLETPKYFDRDLSWLSFNKRVLEEAGDQSVPLYERIKFLAIYSSNLDEFFRVRVAALRSIANIGKKKINKELGLNPDQLLKQILSEVNDQLNEFGRIDRGELMPALQENNIIIYGDEPLLKKHRKVVRQYFKSNVLSYLQPVVINEGMKTPPFLINRALYFIVELTKTGDEEKHSVFATLNIPTDHLSRYFELPVIEDVHYFIHLDDIILRNIDFLFPGYEVVSCHSVKLNRDADLHIEDEYSGDLVEKIRKQLSSRNLGVPSRFLYDNAMPEHMLDFLIHTYELTDEDVVSGGRYHNRSDMMSFPNPFGSKLENKRQKPIEKRGLENVVSLFEAVEERDYMLHFPYQSYDYVLRFFNEAAIDPDVKEIKATFYRVASDSFIMNALISAAKNGKKVTVFVELKARFDEANNLMWAEKMQQEGVNIIYSIPGLKVHAKMALVIRETESGNKGFAFLGTGNFNEKTASIYADHGLLTCHDGIISEMNKVFKFLYKRKEVGQLDHLLVSQFNIVDRLKEMIDREIAHATTGKQGHIIIKINNLEEASMIDKLYEASCAGVKVELIIRGICAVIPGVEGMSENITVRRIVDRYLEHARIFMFLNNGEDELYMGSADWMSRNLFKRIEVVFPIYDEEAKSEIKKLISLQLSDNTKARMLDEFHNNTIIDQSGELVTAQSDFYKWLKKREVEVEE